jgi:hypothetical protein
LIPPWQAGIFGHFPGLSGFPGVSGKISGNSGSVFDSCEKVCDFHVRLFTPSSRHLDPFTVTSPFFLVDKIINRHRNHHKCAIGIALTNLSEKMYYSLRLKKNVILEILGQIIKEVKWPQLPLFIVILGVNWLLHAYMYMQTCQIKQNIIFLTNFKMSFFWGQREYARYIYIWIIVVVRINRDTFRVADKMIGAPSKS